MRLPWRKRASMRSADQEQALAEARAERERSERALHRDTENVTNRLWELRARNHFGEILAAEIEAGYGRRLKREGGK